MCNGFLANSRAIATYYKHILNKFYVMNLSKNKIKNKKYINSRENYVVEWNMTPSGRA